MTADQTTVLYSYAVRQLASACVICHRAKTEPAPGWVIDDTTTPSHDEPRHGLILLHKPTSNRVWVPVEIDFGSTISLVLTSRNDHVMSINGDRIVLAD